MGHIGNILLTYLDFQSTLTHHEVLNGTPEGEGSLSTGVTIVGVPQCDYTI